MRDVVLLAILGIGCIYAMRQPWIGAMLWTWVSLMSPHQFGWWTGRLPIGAAVAAITLIGVFITRDKHNPFRSAPAVALLLFTVWICVTLPFSFYLSGSLSLWERSMKIFLMLFVTMALIDDRKKLNVFIAVIVFSIGFFGVKGGIFTLATGGNYRVWGPGGFIEGNNELALALVMTIPLMRYLQTQTEKRWVIHLLTVCMALTAVTVLGTYSRGALLAIIAMGFFMWLKGTKKLQWGVMLIAVAIVGLALMPEQWWARMETIQTYDQDASAMGRINAWHMAWNLAKANFFGGGFSIYNSAVFQSYAPVPDDVHAAHSIYFQVLGEHGFIGLFLFLLVMGLTWTKAGQITRLARRVPGASWASALGPMIQVSLVGYAVGGAFLSLAYFDLPYNMLAVVCVAQFVIEREKAATVATRGVAGAAPHAHTGIRRNDENVEPFDSSGVAFRHPSAGRPR